MVRDYDRWGLKYNVESPSSQYTADSVLLVIVFEFLQSAKTLVLNMVRGTIQHAENIKEEDDLL